MRYKRGIDRIQDSFLPSCLDDYIDSEHICRVISAFTEGLDMVELGFKYASTKETGRKPFDPCIMLNLYIYGYLNRVRSSRRLEMESARNIEVMWLLNKMVPDDRTIANFRKDNSAALKKAFRSFVIMLRKLGLYGAEIIAIDGTKIRANNNNFNNYNTKTAEKSIAKIDKRICEYLKELDEGDNQKSAEVTQDKEKIRKAIQKLTAKKTKIESILPKANQPGGASIIDPDAHMMKQGGDSKGNGVAYNIQSAVDEKNGLIVDFEITHNSSDLGNLKSMTDNVKEALGVKELTVLADRGYYKGEDIVACENANVTCLVAKPNRNNNKRSKNLDPKFAFEYFTYNKEKDCYTCPMGQELRFRSMQKYRDHLRRYYCNTKACLKCSCKSKCTTGGPKGIVREEYQDVLDIVDERTKNNPELYRKRQQIVEHPFGTVKKGWGYSQFLCRTTPKVSGETSLTFFAYNLRRVLTVFGGEIKNLIQKVQAI